MALDFQIKFEKYLSLLQPKKQEEKSKGLELATFSSQIHYSISLCIFCIFTNLKATLNLLLQ